VVIGAGYIGLEVAASARKRGLDVTVLEMDQRCLSRVTSPVVSQFYAQRHAQEGVRLHCGARVTALIGSAGGAVSAVACADGTTYPADAVVVGVGVLPNIELAQSAGIACDNGIVVDEFCRTSQANVYAAGDCTNHPSVRYGGRVRLESVDNAVEQGRTAAAHICGKATPHAHVPWFWSDQYNVKLQTAGLLQGHDQQVIRGDATAGQFSVWYLKAGELLAVDAINKPGDFIVAKKWIAERKHPDTARLAELGVELKGL
jgi:3-phenylpropionate/trans-cinnamate dioxygenase ferredoxin reductase subunit